MNTKNQIQAEYKAANEELNNLLSKYRTGPIEDAPKEGELEAAAVRRNKAAREAVLRKFCDDFVVSGVDGKSAPDLPNAALWGAIYLLDAAGLLSLFDMALERQRKKDPDAYLEYEEKALASGIFPYHGAVAIWSGNDCAPGTFSLQVTYRPDTTLLADEHGVTIGVAYFDVNKCLQEPDLAPLVEHLITYAGVKPGMAVA